VLFHDLVQTSRRVAATSGRLAKIDLVAALLKRAGPDEIEIAIAFLSGSLRQGRIGIGYATLQAAQPEQAATAPTLELAAVDAALQRLAMTTGKVTVSVRARITAKRNSVQPNTKTKIAVAATPGAASGSVMRQITPSRPQPSTSPLSSTSKLRSTRQRERSSDKVTSKT